MSAASEKADRAWGSLEGSIRPRRWEALRNSWVRFVPEIMPPGSVPNVTVSTFLEDSAALIESVPQRNELTTITFARSELPATVFREAVYWLHKSLHVLGASESHVDGGMPTWSLSSAYQSSYFAARSIMAFLGIGVGEYFKISFAVDLCRNMQGLKPQRLGEIGAFEEEVPFRSVGVLFDHRQVWTLFQRVLRVTSCKIWPDGWANFLTLLDVTEFTEQRHGLHYQLGYWVADDLNDFVYSEEFRNVAPTGNGRTLFDAGSPNFSLRLATIVTRLGLLLFTDLCGLTNRLQDERQVVVAALSFERHPLFVDVLRGDASLFKVTQTSRRNIS